MTAITSIFVYPVTEAAQYTGTNGADIADWFMTLGTGNSLVFNSETGGVGDFTFNGGEEVPWPLNAGEWMVLSNPTSGSCLIVSDALFDARYRSIV